jgi:hypothetical protein
LKRLRDQLLSHKNVVWFHEYGQPLPVDQNKPYDAANRVMDLLYGECRNRFAHDDFNQLRARIRRNQRVALKEAVEKLLDYTQGLVIDTSFAQNRGDKRYPERCLLQQGALRQAKTEGSRLRCEVEQNEAAFEKNLPAMAAMVREVKGLQTDKKLSLTDWLLRYRRAPYGQGPIALAVSLAYVRRRFGDSIHIKPEDSQIGEMPLSSFDEVVDLLESKYPGAFVSYRPVRPHEKALTTIVFETFGQPDSAAAATRSYGVQEAHDAIKGWWDSLPPLARVVKLYSADEQPEAAGFVAAVAKIAAREPHSFIFDDLPDSRRASRSCAGLRQQRLRSSTCFRQVQIPSSGFRSGAEPGSGSTCRRPGPTSASRSRTGCPRWIGPLSQITSSGSGTISSRCRRHRATSAPVRARSRACRNSSPPGLRPLMTDRWSRLSGTRRIGGCPRGA